MGFDSFYCAHRFPHWRQHETWMPWDAREHGGATWKLNRFRTTADRFVDDKPMITVVTTIKFKNSFRNVKRYYFVLFVLKIEIYSLVSAVRGFLFDRFIIHLIHFKCVLIMWKFHFCFFALFVASIALVRSTDSVDFDSKSRIYFGFNNNKFSVIFFPALT